MRLSQTPVFLLLFTSCAGLAEEAAKPVCDAAHRAQLWPGNGSGRQVEICTQKGRKFVWQPVTIDIAELRKKPKAKTP